MGSTATGKSDLGVALARRLGGEVVSADASQLYRGMDVGTAKLTVAERRGVPHHQLDVLEVTEEASVAAYQRHARADVAAVLARGGVPVVVGGSGLYVRALLDRLDIPPTDARVRAEISSRLEREGVAALYGELAGLDPAAAAAIEPTNGRRVVRALEVIRVTGRPFSATMPRRDHVRPTVVLGLRMARETLDERVLRRTRAMFRRGLVAETHALVYLGLREGRTASRAVGYAQALRVIDGGMTLEEATADTALRTRRLARRQESWFGADPRVHWLDALDPDLEARAVDFVAAGRAEVAGRGPERPGHLG